MGRETLQRCARSLGRLAVLSAAVLGFASPARAVDARWHGQAATGRSSAVLGGKALAVAASTRPLCRLGWHLSGSQRQGFLCARGTRRARPSCRPHQQLRARGRRYVCLPISAGVPTPQTVAPTTPQPAPSAPSTTTSAPAQTLDQVLVNGAFEYAKYYAEKELAEAFYNHVYYWKIEPNGCAVIAPNRAECVVLIYKEVELLNYDTSSIATVSSRFNPRLRPTS